MSAEVTKKRPVPDVQSKVVLLVELLVDGLEAEVPHELSFG